MKRLERLQGILHQLQSKRLVLGKDLADRYGVSLRTIYRDMVSLQETGVPILSEAGLGYSLPKDYKMPSQQFSDQEALSLLVARQVLESFPDTGALQSYEDSLWKIRSNLDTSLKDQLEFWESKMKISGFKGQEMAGESIAFLNEIRQGLFQNKVLHLKYYSHYRRSSEAREVEPIGLHFYYQKWHLIAWCRKREAYRDFRIDRIEKMSLLETHYHQSERLSLKEYLKQMKSDQNPMEASIEFAKRAVPYISDVRWEMGYTGREETTNWGVLMHFKVPDFEYLARWLLMFPREIQVKSPQALKERYEELVESFKA